MTVVFPLKGLIVLYGLRKQVVCVFISLIVFVVLALLLGRLGINTVANASASHATVSGHDLDDTSASSSIGTTTVVTYYSSVDGTALEYMEYLPAGFNPATANPLAILLHGSGGNMNQYDTPAWHAAADSHGYILALIHARTVPGYGASRMTFYVDGALVPGEQDILDIMPAVKARHTIDPNRIYLGGYSMGGIGALNVATLNPGIFAAAAPGAPASDLFQEYSAFVISPPNLATVLGGQAGQSVVTDTYWYQNSPRFLLPNLMHTPIRVVHGVSDTVIPNSLSIAPYMQSRHVIDTPGYVDGRGRATTLQGLRATWPGAYYEEHLWPNADHGGASLSWIPEEVLTFFDAHVLVTQPLTVAFTTYEDKHTGAYWLQLDLTRPWTAMPGQVYAVRDPAANTVRAQVTGSITLSLDMAAMGLTNTQPLTVVVQPIGAPASSSDVALVLSGAWSTDALASVSVTRDGASLSPDAYDLALTRFTLLRLAIGAPHTYVITTTDSRFRLYLPLVLK
jgi:predicted esterase